MRARILAMVLLGVLTFGARAQADEASEKQRCLAAYVAGQDAREKGRLRDAKTEFETCGQDHCPAAARKDCLEWLTQTNASLPSVVVTSADDEGKAVEAVAITLDGQPFAQRSDGRAVPIDPGPHTFKFEAPDHEPDTVELVILEGQKNRLVSGKLIAKNRAKKIVAELPPAPRSRTTGIAAGGFAIVSLGFGVGFAVSGVSDMKGLESGCGATVSCRQEDVDDARTKLIVGDVLLGVGLIAAAASAYLLLR